MLKRAWRIAIGRSLLKPHAEQHMSPSQSAHVDVQHPIPKKKKEKKKKKRGSFQGSNCMKSVWKTL